MKEKQKILMVALISSCVSIIGYYALSTYFDKSSTPTAAPCCNTGTIQSGYGDIDSYKSRFDASSNSIEILNQQLAIEEDNRQRLELEIQWLHSMLEEATSPTSTKESISNTSKARAAELWFDDQALLTLGIEQDQVDRIKDAVNKAELNKLYLRNQIARGDPAISKSFGQEMKKIQLELRNSLSEQDYDRMLYATGRNNRVEVSDTLLQSPAEAAGIHNNDKILSYDGIPIYQPNELYQATIKGNIGETVPIEVLRNNEIVTVYVSRGPLGTRLKSIRSAPQ